MEGRVVCAGNSPPKTRRKGAPISAASFNRCCALLWLSLHHFARGVQAGYLDPIGGGHVPQPSADSRRCIRSNDRAVGQPPFNCCIAVALSSSHRLFDGPVGRGQRAIGQFHHCCVLSFHSPGSESISWYFSYRLALESSEGSDVNKQANRALPKRFARARDSWLIIKTSQHDLSREHCLQPATHSM